MAKAMVAALCFATTVLAKPEGVKTERRQVEGFDVQGLLQDVLGNDASMFEGFDVENVKFVDSKEQLLRKEQEVIEIKSNPFNGINPFAPGPCETAMPIHVQGNAENGLEGISDVYVYAPLTLPESMKFTTMLHFSVDKGTKPSHYASFINHLVTHGYTVIVPDVEGADMEESNGSGTGWIHRSARVAEKVSRWSVSVPDILESNKIFIPVQADTESKPVMLLVGHGAGSASQICFVTGCVMNEQEHVQPTNDLHFVSLFGIDPVNLDAENFGMKLEKGSLTAAPAGVPLIVWSAGGGITQEGEEQSEAVQKNEGCVPKELNYENFLSAWTGPTSHVKTDDAGHDDILDDGVMLRDVACTSDYDSSNRDSPRSFVAGFVTGFADSLLGRGRKLDDFKLMLRLMGLESEVLDRIKAALLTETSQNVEVNGGADAALKEWEKALNEDDVKIHHVKNARRGGKPAGPQEVVMDKVPVSESGSVQGHPEL